MPTLPPPKPFVWNKSYKYKILIKNSTRSWYSFKISYTNDNPPSPVRILGLERQPILFERTNMKHDESVEFETDIPILPPDKTRPFLSFKYFCTSYIGSLVQASCTMGYKAYSMIGELTKKQPSTKNIVSKSPQLLWFTTELTGQ
jgi:hypothetical protein